MKGVLLLAALLMFPSVLPAQDQAIIITSHSKAVYEPNVLYEIEGPIPKPVGLNAVTLRLVLDRTDFLDPNVIVSYRATCSEPGFPGGASKTPGGEIMRNGEVITTSAIGFSVSADCPSYVTSFIATGGQAHIGLTLQMWEDN